MICSVTGQYGRGRILASEMGLKEEGKQMMAPVPPKTQRDIADAVDKWLEGLRRIPSHTDTK